MITEKEKEVIVNCAKKYNVTSVFLFGSAIEKKRNANDIDVGVKGLSPQFFFKFYAELFKLLPKPVDLIDLSYKSLFTDLVEQKGIKIYG